MTASRTHPMPTTPNPNPLHQRAQALRLPGLLAHWGEAAQAPWLAQLLGQSQGGWRLDWLIEENSGA